MITDKDFMNLAFKLALKGRGHTWTNPLVGAILVKNHNILSQGYHHEFGKAHAEIDALNKLDDINDAIDSTMYVTLEPCSHFGKTPPCAKRIVEAGIKRVVIGQLDPNPLVAGKGAKILTEAGIEVNILDMRLAQNFKYNFFYEQHRPFITAKYAMTLDGKVNYQSNMRSMITGKESFLDTQKLRSKNQAILIGEKTLLTDNPSLNIRVDSVDFQPYKVVLVNDAATLNLELNIFKSLSKTFVLSRKKTNRTWPENIIVVTDSKWTPHKIIEFLSKQGIQSLLIEGGSHIHSEFLASELIDELFVYISPTIFGGGALPAVFGRKSSLQKFQLVNREFIGLDTKFQLRRI